MQPSHSPEDKARLILLMESFLSSPDPFAELFPEINTYREYIASLPYVIKVDGEKSVLVAHADLPCGFPWFSPSIFQTKFIVN